MNDYASGNLVLRLQRVEIGDELLMISDEILDRVLEIKAKHIVREIRQKLEIKPGKLYKIDITVRESGEGWAK